MTSRWRYNNANADLYQTYNNGVPTQVTVLNTPLTVQEDLDANFGIYAQDSWNLNKLTVNYGLHFDLNKQSIVGQNAMQGRFANVPAYSDIEFPTWTDLSPRLSAIYDIAGDGKTAVRAGLNKFVTARRPGFAQLYNPTALTTELFRGPTPTAMISHRANAAACSDAGCEIDFRTLPRTSASARWRSSIPTSSGRTRWPSTSASPVK